MASRFRFVFAVFFLTAILILAVHLRNSNNRTFYELCTLRAHRDSVRQELWQRQIELENLISPTAVSRTIDIDP